MKKIILTAFAALMALAVFTSCEYKADYTAADAVADKNQTITSDSKPTISGGYWSTAGGIDDNAKAFYFNAGSWASYKMDLANPINCDKAKITIEMYGDGLSDGGTTNYFKIGLATTDKIVSEISTNDKKVFIDIAKLCEATVDEPYKVTFNTDDMWVGYSEDKSNTPAYLPCITQIIVNPQDSCSGKVFIKSIKIVNSEE